MVARSLIVLGLTAAVGVAGCVRQARVASPLVKAASVRQVTLGSSVVEVRELLGAPADEEVTGTGADAHTTYVYTRQFYSPFVVYPMLWVHLDAGHVTSVYVKQYGPGWDERGVYLLSEGAHIDESDALDALLPDD